MRGFCPSASAAVLIAALGSGSALAQSAASAPAGQNPADAAPSERAKRDADKVFHWILIQGDRTRKTGKDASTSKDDRAAGAAGTKAAQPPAQGAQPVRSARADADAPATPAAVRPKADSTLAATPLAPSTGTDSTASALPTGSAAVVLPAAASVNADSASSASSATGSATAINKADVAPRIDDSSKPDPTSPAAERVDVPVDLIPISQPEPQFPVTAMRTLRKGAVQVKFTVQTDGSVSDIEVLHTTSPRINAAATAAIGQWRFQPISRPITGAVELGFNIE